jgi:hypothetical protein
MALGLMLSSSVGAACAFAAVDADRAGVKPRKTAVSIVGDEFRVNGRPTYAGRVWQGHRIQGLLLNSRMVQGIFDDRNPATVAKWVYPDTGRWDPERNTQEFIAAMPEWRRHALLAFTINLQGGCPLGYAQDQPWHNSALEADGALRADYLGRLERILDAADQLGMVVILGYFYFGQDQRLQDEAAVIGATDQATQWLLGHGYRHVLVEINNECNVSYDHAILRPGRVHELIERVKRTTRDGRRLLAGTSYGGGTVPGENVVRASDFLLLHGNGVSDPRRIAAMVHQTRQVPGYTPKPVLFNEDDHFDFDKPLNNFVAAVSEYASWGYFDYRMKGEDFDNGYQSVPVNWGISSERKRGFFRLLGQITGADADGPATGAGITITQTNYHGWPGSILMSNGKVEVIIVPAVGRVMQFRFAGETDGPFWENRALDGRAPDPKSPEWGNFGGDKTWPAPQADWPKVADRGWPPPPAFDSMPVKAEVSGDTVTLLSPVDPFYGIRTRRVIALERDQLAMRIETTYEKVTGEPRKVGVWVITQLKEPVAVFLPVPEASLYASGYSKQSEALPANLRVADGLLSLTRDPKMAAKIGSDAGTLLWVGKKTVLRIDSVREPRAEYPDQGSSAEVYTNPDPHPYVELELLGPLQTLRVGGQIKRSNAYALSRRSKETAEAEARTWLGR